MDDERWLQLVARLEAQAERDPRRYRRRVARFAALGYAYIAVALAAVLGLAALVVYVGIHHGLLLRLLLPIGGVALLILRSLAVRIDPPEGIPASRAEAPALYDIIDGASSAACGWRACGSATTSSWSASSGPGRSRRLSVRFWFRKVFSSARKR